MTVLKFVFIHFIFDLSVMKKKLMMCFAKQGYRCQRKLFVEYV